MGKRENLIKELKRFKENTKTRIDVSQIILFGSQAKGNTHKDSDVDLIVVSKDFEGKKFRYRAAELYDYWNLEYAVDFLCYTPKEFQRFSRQATIIREALKNGVEI